MGTVSCPQAGDPGAPHLLQLAPGHQINPRWLARAGDSSTCLIQNRTARLARLAPSILRLFLRSPQELLRRGNGTLLRPEADGADDNRRPQNTVAHHG